MPNRVHWDPRFSVGHEVIDAQHQAILAHIDALADCLDAGNAEASERFLTVFEAFKARAREHFEAEAALLARNGCPTLDAHDDEQQEYGYLEAEIITTVNFDPDELQTFLSLWWIGHIAGNARNLRPWLEQRAAS